MERVETLQREKRVLSRAEFEKKYAHLWLIVELDEGERQMLFRTMVSSTRRAVAATRRTRGGSMAADLEVEPERYVLYPLTKSGANPWSDRVCVGRAANNDVVLKNVRISKLHAYFHRQRGAWRLTDAKSANGTRLDGALVPPGEDGIEVKGGEQVAFATITGELIASAELYDAL
jgi:pSer/pThr/pTyr-binding forkhead associated (FHA) protein